MTVHPSLLVRWSLLTALLVLLLKVGGELLAYPEVVTTAGTQAPIYLILFGLAILMYGWFALFRTKASTPAERMALRQGVLWGLLCGVVWIIELLVANVGNPQVEQFSHILYYGTALAGYLLPGLVGLLTAWRTRRITLGLQAGLLCGMFGGLMIFLASFVLSALFLQAGQSDPQTIHEFQRSGLPDITTYMVGDYLGGMIAHLWIGLITGSFLGALGGAIGKAILLPEKMTLEEDRIQA
ncbi:MAG: hypothetical protein JO031_04295 [Ktedonobacteraceae bacterium]|nr:hypothetical protein [Ktedonobacteraceae bacterium]